MLVQAPVGVRYTPAGSVPRTVAVGELIGSFAPETGVDTDQPKTLNDNIAERAKLWTGRVRAPITGQLVAATDGARINATGTDIVAALTPLQELRFRSMRYTGEATVETPSGQYTAPCRALWLQQPPIGAPQADEDTTTSTVAGRLHCRVPTWVETAVGLRSRITITAATIKDALLVPSIAIAYDTATDAPYVTVIDGEKQTRVAVTLGATDGVLRVVSGKLSPGQTLKRVQNS